MKRAILFLSFILCALTYSVAQPKSSDNIRRYILDNGLELYVAEDHVVPLVYIEIAVRTGAISQTPDTAGLFHLYEHMMFKGNALYPTAGEVNRALSDMGVASWNGTTSTAHVNYFFTIPSDKLESGLAFWNAAIRSPIINERELESEKRVVLAEIEGSKADPSRVMTKYLNAQMFPDAPYKTDPSGSFDVVKAATVSSLCAIQKQFYVPNNAALFVGGDVNPDEVYDLVKRIWGTWQRGKDIAQPFHHTRKPLSNTRFCVMPSAKMSDGIAQIMIQFRGPDAYFDREDTWATDYLMYLMDESDGIFTRSLYENDELKILDFNDLWASYITSLNIGKIEFGTIVDALQGDIAHQARVFVSLLQDKILPDIVSAKMLYAKAHRKALVTREQDQNTKATQTAASTLKDLRSWWVNTDYEYYESYWKRLSQVSQQDVKRVVDKYLVKSNALVSVLVSPAVYEAMRNEADSEGFYRIRDDEPFWWQTDRWQTDAKAESIDRADDVAHSNDEIYRPSDLCHQGRGVKITRSITHDTLKNGIPVYIHQTDSDVQCVAIFCKGGVNRLSSDTSGLETTLFSFMSKSSKSYNYEERTKFYTDTGTNVGYISKLSGTALYMTSLGKHFDKSLKVFVDGFLCPVFESEQYEAKMKDLSQSVKSILNTPDKLLAYSISDALYKGHPYDAKTYVTPLSIDNITVDNLRAHHDHLLTEGGIFVVASGKINAKRLVKSLNGTLGNISGQHESKMATPPHRITVAASEPVVLRLDSLRGSANVSRVFTSPPNTSDEFMSCVLAADAYTDVLFNVVREHYGICYTPESYVVGSHAGYGVEHLYKVSDLAGFFDATAEARSYMAQGKLVDSTAEDGTFRFVSLDERLEGYKRSYINRTYVHRQISLDMVEALGYNLMQFGDIDHDLEDLDKLERIGADEVLRVFNKYWVESDSAWYAVTGISDKLIFGTP